MVKTKKKKKSKLSPGLIKSATEVALIVPEGGVNLALGSYNKFMKPFLHDVTKRVTRLDKKKVSPSNVKRAFDKTLRSPKFKKAWYTTVSDIFNVLIKPILLNMVKLIEKEGMLIGGSIVKIIAKISRRAAGAVGDGIEGAMSAIPGVGSILDILNIGQAMFDSMATLSIESIKILTRLLVSIMSLGGSMVVPLAKTGKIIKKLIGSIPHSSKRRKKKNKKKETFRKYRCGVIKVYLFFSNH